MVDSDTSTYQATEHVRQVFGEEPVVVLAQGDLQRLILTNNIFRLLRLEGCLSGKVPRGARPLPGACAELAELDPVAFLAGQIDTDFTGRIVESNQFGTTWP